MTSWGSPHPDGRLNRIWREVKNPEGEGIGIICKAQQAPGKAGKKLVIPRSTAREGLLSPALITKANCRELVTIGATEIGTGSPGNNTKIPAAERDKPSFLLPPLSQTQLAPLFYFLHTWV